MYSHRRSAKLARKLRHEAGLLLRQLREKRGLSQRELAQKVGVEYYTLISQLENGRGRIPPDRYLAWAHALGLEPREFVLGLMPYYDPVTYNIIFGHEARTDESDTSVKDSRAQSPLIGRTQKRQQPTTRRSDGESEDGLR
jgi:transcriptional regulator with XRE-family HTH domain